MIQKKIMTALSLMAVSVLSACGQVKSKITVVDEEGKPIEGAEVFFSYVNFKNEENLSVMTNEEGVAESTGSAELRVNLRVTKEDYYDTRFDKSEGTALGKDRDHDLKVVLKKVIKKIPLYARSLKVITPSVGEPIGFDFSKSDWVHPYGSGKVTDVFFTISYFERSKKDYDYTLFASFPNKFDGLQEFEIDRSSELKSKHEAPVGGYLPSWKQEVQRRPETGRVGNRDRNRCFWLRIRSQFDDDENLVSANYVKIYGDFPEFTYYFNPTPNDRNLEFDPEKNLFKNLPHSEQVREP